MSDIPHRVLRNMRRFLAGISEQIFYYFALFAGFVAWVYFDSLFAAIVVGIAGIALAWWLSTVVEGKTERQNR